MSDEKPLDAVRDRVTGDAAPEASAESPRPRVGGARPGAGRPKGSGKKSAIPVSIRGPDQQPPDPEQVKMHATMAVSLLISIPITAMKLEPYTEPEAKLMSDATLPVLEKYAGEMLIWMGPELALFGVAMMVLGPKIQKRRMEIAEAQKAKEKPPRENIFNPT